MTSTRPDPRSVASRTAACACVVLLGAGLVLSGCATTSSGAADPRPRPAKHTRADRAATAQKAFGALYSHLSRHGSFAAHPRLGWVFRPKKALVGKDFEPYATAGRWRPTDLGWIFVSDLPFGWITFHYGRWAYEPREGGWLWVPGPHWAPAWVAWRADHDVVAWAPLPPRLRVGVRVEHIRSLWVAAPRAVLGAALTTEKYLRGAALHAALVKAKPLRATDKTAFVRWYRGPALPSGPSAVTIAKLGTHPAPSTLVRLRAAEGSITLQVIGPLVIKPRGVAPRPRSALRPAPWTEQGDVFPVMPGVGSRRDR